MTETTTIRECGKCAGTGHIAAFAGIANGTCFSCKGAGGFATTEAKERRRVTAAARREAKRLAEAEARWAARLQDDFAAAANVDEFHDLRCRYDHDHKDQGPRACTSFPNKARLWKEMGGK